MSADDKAQLIRQVNEKFAWYNRGSRAWSTAHHSSLYLGAILSAAAALVLKLDFLNRWPYRTDVAAAAAAIAALLATIAAAGGFDRKWRANRISRGKVDELRIDLSDPNVDVKAVRERLKAIVEAHDQGIAGMTR